MTKAYSFFAIVITFITGCKHIVEVSGEKIFVDGEQYAIRGICYNPIKKGHSRLTEYDFSRLDQDIELMRNANINTIRTYYPIKDEEVLDKFADNEIKIIIGFPNVDDRMAEIKGPDIQSESYLNYINTYKNHPAILMWEFGNEYNYHPEWFDNNLDNWYRLLEKAAINTIQIDPNHPVSTANGDLPTTQALKLAPSVQIWGINVYRWDDPTNIFKEWKQLSKKPMYFSEAGTDSWDNEKGKEDRAAQAKAIKNILSTTIPYYPFCIGIAIFEFNDEWWKAGEANKQNSSGDAPYSLGVPYDAHADEEYWGIVDIERSPKPSYFVLKDEYEKLKEKSLPMKKLSEH